ncbi:helix-turn-helix domain-containing protein [uncultured Duncaniella sp.]|uniref:helix-turn-helix domain-containing protein n=1 Tax=uncultured Duncaniella sp. TaxID=2768039 RepID=UPI0025B44A33|nr:helix-turn-helix domain-containing protein [uncultured Duncaniella sp.]
MEVVQIEKEALDMMFERMAYLHDMVHTLFERLRDKKFGDWLTPEETAEILNISTRQVRNLQNGGKIGFIRHGRKCCYKAEDVYALIKRGGCIE